MKNIVAKPKIGKARNQAETKAALPGLYCNEPHSRGNEQAFMLNRKFNRSLMLGLTLLASWLMWAAPVSWTACTAMSLRMLTPECRAASVCGKPFQNMQEGCLLQLGGFSNYLAVPTASLHLPPPLALPPTLLETLLRKPQVSALASLVDVSPPPRPRPLRLYYHVFLK